MNLLKKAGVLYHVTALESRAPSSGTGEKPLPRPRDAHGSAERALPAGARSSEERCNCSPERLSHGGSVAFGANHTENKFVRGALTA